MQVSGSSNICNSKSFQSGHNELLTNKVGVSMDKMLFSPSVICRETDYKNKTVHEKYELALRLYSCSTFKL